MGTVNMRWKLRSCGNFAWCSHVATVFLLASVALAAPAGDRGAAPSRPAGGVATSGTRSVSQSYQAVPVTNGGLIAGRITNHNENSKRPPPLQISQDQEFCGETVPDDRLVKGPEGGLQGVVVSLDGLDRGKSRPQHNILLRNTGCRFLPHVQGAMLGQEIEVINDDPVLHNSHALWGGRSAWNVALPLEGLVSTQKLPTEPGVVEMRCDVHPWMSAWIVVFRHPYFTTSGPEGYFTIDDVPPGTYTVRAWHPLLGEDSRQVKVIPGSRSEVVFTLAH